jgi:hypothetical protein
LQRGRRNRDYCGLGRCDLCSPMVGFEALNPKPTDVGIVLCHQQRPKPYHLTLAYMEYPQIPGFLFGSSEATPALRISASMQTLSRTALLVNSIHTLVPHILSTLQQQVISMASVTGTRSAYSEQVQGSHSHRSSAVSHNYQDNLDLLISLMRSSSMSEPVRQS